MNNIEVINKFYQSFAEGDAEKMTSFYHDNVIFEDPAFGTLEGDKAKSMWRMLLSNKQADIKITFDDVTADENTGSASWKAVYSYGPNKRRVVNEISAKFKFKDGQIIDHRDSFNLWKWSQQAMGFTGYLIGWSPLMKKKIQNVTKVRLEKYMGK